MNTTGLPFHLSSSSSDAMGYSGSPIVRVRPRPRLPIQSVAEEEEEVEVPAQPEMDVASDHHEVTEFRSITVSEQP